MEAKAQVDFFQIVPRGQFSPLQQVSISGLISAAVNIILIIAVLLFVFSLLLGGIKFILSGGRGEKFDEAKRQLINAFLGLVIVFSTWVFLSYASNFFGIDFTRCEIPTL